VHSLDNLKEAFVRRVHVAAHRVEDFAKNIVLKAGVALGVAAVPIGAAAWAYLDHPAEFAAGAMIAAGAAIAGAGLWAGAKVAAHVHYHDDHVDVSAPAEPLAGREVE
jgi:lipid-binding SYLF domain-containing protein